MGEAGTYNLIPRPSRAPVFDHLQYALAIKSWRWGKAQEWDYYIYSAGLKSAGLKSAGLKSAGMM